MSPSIKLAALALISSAAAAPHYSHSRFHRPSGFHGTGPAAGYPTGGFWQDRNNTAHPLPTGGNDAYPGDKTTTLLETSKSTVIVTSTVYATKPAGGAGGAPSSVGVEDFVKPTGDAGCGPQTVTVTATNQVTVTVGGGEGHAPSSAAEAAHSSAPGEGYGTGHSSVVEERISFPNRPVQDKTTLTAFPTKDTFSILPIHTGSPAEGEAPKPSDDVPKPTQPTHSAVESQAPKPSSNPVHSGGKRGLAYNDLALCSAFGNGKFSFAYNWASAENGNLPEGVKFTPMMHRPSLQTPEKWLQDVAAAVEKGSDVVMGFNEPDHSAQANLSPDEACKQWNNYMEPIVSAHPGVTILGPSVTNGPAPMGLDWLSRFSKSCPDATWHAANIHFYDIYEKDLTVQRFQAQVEQAAKDTGKPVWVTEFGLNPGSASGEQAADFLKGCMAFMDSSDLVQGYSYFMVGTGENQLNGGNGLSSVGQVYASA